MKYYLLFSFLLGACLSFAQTAEKDSLVHPELLLPQKKRPYLKANVSFGLISDGVSTSRLWKFSSDDFLDEQEKTEFLEQTGNRLRYGLVQEFEVIYREPTYMIFDRLKTGYGVRIRNRYYNSASLSKNLLELIFFGNKAYEDQKVNLGESSYETWYFTSLEYMFDVMVDSLQPLSVHIGIQVGHDHSHYSLSGGSLYTAPDGEYLDLQIDYRLREQSSGVMAFAGLGIGVGAETSFRLSEKSKLEILAEDLGVMNWNRGNKLETDSSFRFGGLSFNNIFDLNDSLTKHKSDQYKEAFIYNEGNNYLSLLPFYLRATYTQKTEAKLEEWFITADYHYISGYFPRLALGAVWDMGYKKKLTGSISSGGYNWFSLSTGYQFVLASDWNIHVALQNINGLLLPESFGGAMAYLALSYEF